jgi:membrane protease YdiL (CAAX protease family)
VAIFDPNNFQLPTDLPERLTAMRKSPAPNNPPWSSGAAVIVWISSILFIVILQGLVVASLAVRSGIKPTDSAALTELLKTDPQFALAAVLAVIPAHVLTLVLAWFVITGANKFSFADVVGWKWGGFKVVHLIAIIVFFFGTAYFLNQFIPEQENDMLRMLRSSRQVVYAIAILATFTAPIVEEVIYRGVLFSAFQRSFGVNFAVASVTILFAVVHVPQYWPSYATIFLLLILSLFLTIIRARTGNLLPCIVTHAVFNAIQSAALVADPSAI